MSGEECESDMDYSEEECGYEDYYNTAEDCDIESVDASKTDPEYFVFECLSVEEVERLLNESVEALSTSLQITPSLAKVLLHTHGWAIDEISDKYRADSTSLLVASNIKPAHSVDISWRSSSSPRAETSCPVCAFARAVTCFCSLACGHAFCRDCWAMHFEVKIMQGVSTGIGCMAQECEVLAPEDMILSLLTRPNLREKYQQFAFRDYVKSHPELRFCPGPNCQVIVRAKEPAAKRALCTSCKTSF
ncbi:hypothetical protein J437_LFUL014711, partial [Ladona fulva]